MCRLCHRNRHAARQSYNLPQWAAYSGSDTPEKTMSTKPTPSPDEGKRQAPDPDEEAGTNAVEHEPDPKAKPIPDGEHKYVRRSPFTTGND